MSDFVAPDMLACGDSRFSVDAFRPHRALLSSAACLVSASRTSPAVVRPAAGPFLLWGAVNRQTVDELPSLMLKDQLTLEKSEPLVDAIAMIDADLPGLLDTS